MKKKAMKKLGRIFAITLVIAFVMMTGNNTAAVHAQELTWINPGDGWHYLMGTDIKVKTENNAVYIYGTGAIPDFDYYKLYERPWAGTEAESVFIDQTITSIGSYAFYGMQKLKHISMYKSTFIKDMTCFDKISYEPIFRIYEAPPATEMIGTIPYTSLDSIMTAAQTNYNGASYILDTQAKAREFQNSTNPTVTNVYYADERLPEQQDVQRINPYTGIEETIKGRRDIVSPWEWPEVYGNGNVAVPICRLSPLTPYASYVVSAQKRYPGKACYEAYAAFIGDYTFAAPFNVSVTVTERVIKQSYEYWEDKKVEQTENELMYILTIPEEFRLPGRSFRLLGIGKGEVYIYDDLDADDSTITFATRMPNTAYALVYK